jgi:hypothetical protein
MIIRGSGAGLPTSWGLSEVEAGGRSGEGREKISAVDRSTIKACPCCFYRTGCTTCPVCFWTDDGQGDADADVVRGGPNGELSLADGRLNFAIYGASHRRYLAVVRAARADERG